MAAINIKRAEFHGEWNYTISPNAYPPKLLVYFLTHPKPKKEAEMTMRRTRRVS